MRAHTQTIVALIHRMVEKNHTQVCARTHASTHTYKIDALIHRVVEEYMLHVGGSIGYWQGDVKKLMDDIGALRPTVFVGVPRVFERICGGIRDQVRV